MISSTGGPAAASLAAGILQGASRIGPMAPAPRPATASSSPVPDALQNARQAVATLRQAASGDGAKDAAKSAARLKLEALKIRLKNLMMFGGDPASRAREAARIAKDIGEAAAEYAQSGGDSPGAPIAAPSAPQPQAPDPLAQANAGTGVTDTPPASIAADPSAGTVAAPDRSGLQPAVLLPPALAGKRAAGGTTAGPAPQAGPNSQAAASARESADQAFINDARLLARRANAILQNAIQEARRKREATGDAGAAGDKALVAIDTASSSLGLAGGADPDAGAGYGAGAQAVAAAPAPAVTTTA